MKKIKVGIVGVGNCASSLIQGIQYYKGKSENDFCGLMHWDINGYKPFDIEVVCAFDVDKRKVGKNLYDAIFEKPNCTKVFCDQFDDCNNVIVSKGKILDGISNHTTNNDNDKFFSPINNDDVTKEDIIKILNETNTDILVNYLPVGSNDASKFYAECALKAKVGFINNIPVFLASNKEWDNKFKQAGVPILGDDIKSQFGATIVHRVLTELFEKRGGIIDRTYQLNTGGNMDFMNMLNRDRLKYKKESKTEAVRSIMNNKLEDENIHVGPSDYVAWQNDNKKCFIRIEGRIFGDVPINMDVQLSVEDSPNSAGVVIDAIRCCKLAIDRKLSGTILAPSMYFFKHQMVQKTDDEDYIEVERFIRGDENE